MGTLSLHLSIWKRRSLVKIIGAEDLETVQLHIESKISKVIYVLHFCSCLPVACDNLGGLDLSFYGSDYWQS